MDNPLVSIVIPVFNGADYLADAIDSALGQSYLNIEVVVINDGSDDDGKTSDIAIRYGNRIRYYEKSNGGVSTALNLGISKMEGEFFSWLSHDDLFYPHKIERQLAYYSSLDEKRSIIFSHEDKIDKSGYLIKKGCQFDFNENDLTYTLLYRRFIGGCSLLIPKYAFQDAGCFSEKFLTVQDYELWFRMMNSGYDLKYLPITSGASRVHDGQTSYSLSLTQIEESNELFTDLQTWLKKDLWINRSRNKELAYLKLAYKFGRQQLFTVCEYDLKKSVEVRHESSQIFLVFNRLIRMMIRHSSRKKLFRFILRRLFD